MSFDSRTDERARLLADPANRTIATVLDDESDALHVRELADRLVARDAGVVDACEYERRVERTVLSLHHDRLPKLDEADLIEYDREANVVASAEPTDVEWRGPAIDELVAHLSTAGGDDDRIGVVTGRNSVIEYGRRLADAAEDELFCMYESVDLLEEECVRRAAAAIDRGVSVYLGSRNAAVRDLAREHLPDATVWEPQLDWLNTPAHPRLGRLALADRRRVMLGVLREPTSDGSDPGESAVVGEGAENPLVVLVRDLLGSRLDHLDFQSENFRNRLST